eukprot:GHVN01102076.1.p1 GENE.GHVN01102076.1~~GHVN01102076.1.p1  ORF type:complete len:314 (+),score=40.81 GHVN01102076.1:95-1036(+)
MALPLVGMRPLECTLVVTDERDLVGRETGSRFVANMKQCGIRTSFCFVSDVLRQDDLPTKFSSALVFLSMKSSDKATSDNDSSTIASHTSIPEPGKLGLSPNGEVLTLGLCGKLLDLLLPNGKLEVHIETQADEDNLKRITDEVRKVTMFSGFVGGEIIDLEKDDETMKEIYYRCSKPDYVVGAASAIAAKLDDELVDESTLLDPDEKPYVPLSKGAESCASKTRACANCTCGRAELEASVGAEEAVKRLEGGGVRSSCGNCYLGDAFRCATCPYMGKAAFKAGDKVELDMGKTGLDVVSWKYPPQLSETGIF